jgi:hypothetical protein
MRELLRQNGKNPGQILGQDQVSGDPVVQPTRRRALGLIGAATAAGGVILTPAQAVAGRPVKRFIPPPIGAKWEFRTADGQTISYERIENGTWLTLPTVRYRWESEGADPLIRSYNPMNGNWLVSHIPDGEPIYAADPDDRRYRWPLTQVGFWRSQFVVRNLSNQTRFDKLAIWTVEGEENLRTPFGRFKTVRLSSTGDGPVKKAWYSKSLGVRVRTHYMTEDQSIVEKNLVSYTLP